MFRTLPPGQKHTREPGEGVRTSRQGARVCALLPVGVCWSLCSFFSACPEVFCLQDASAQLLSRRLAFLADRLGRTCTKMAISCEGTVLHSTYNAKTWNNSPAFRLACDTIGTGKAIYWQPSPFLHNLSSILYRGEAALGVLTAPFGEESPNSASLPRSSPAHVRLDTPR